MSPQGSKRDESGASLIEFALVFPLFFTLLLGMVTGGLAYNTKLSVTQASREAARFGATLPLANYGNNVTLWLAAVASIAERSADGELGSGTSGRYLCVAYVTPSETMRRVESGGTVVNEPNLSCFADGRPAGERRVQVVGQRTEKLEALVYSRTLTLRSQGVSRFEASP